MAASALGVALVLLLLGGFVFRAVGSLLDGMLLRAGGLNELTSIRAKDLIHSEETSFPFGYDKGFSGIGDATFFKSSESLSAIQARIRSLPDATSIGTELFDADNLIVTRRLTSDSTVWYLIRRIQTNDGYYMFDMGASFEGSNFRLMFPYHLVSDDRFANTYSGFQFGEQYATSHGVEEFYDFYESLEVYSLTRTETGFTIRGYLPDLPPSSERDSFQRVYAFSFGESDGEKYFEVG